MSVLLVLPCCVHDRRRRPVRRRQRNLIAVGEVRVDRNYEGDEFRISRPVILDRAAHAVYVIDPVRDDVRRRDVVRVADDRHVRRVRDIPLGEHEGNRHVFHVMPDVDTDADLVHDRKVPVLRLECVCFVCR